MKKIYTLVLATLLTTATFAGGGITCSQTFNGSLDGTEPTQTGRLQMNGVQSVCGTAKPCPGLGSAVGNRYYRSYLSSNFSGVTNCVTVTWSTICYPANPIYVAAYLNSFNPASPCTNFLGDRGISAANGNFSVSVPNGNSIVVVVHSLNVAETCSGYTLTISNINGHQPTIYGVDDTICAGSTINLNSLVNGTIQNPLIWRVGALNGAATSNNVSPAVTTTYVALDSDVTFNCYDTTAVTVFVSSGLTAITDPGVIYCNGDGTFVDISGTGGFSPYTGTGSFLQFAGTTTYTITDAAGCLASASVTLAEPKPLGYTLDITNVSCNGNHDGTVTVHMTGGTPPYSFYVSPFPGGGTTDSSASGIYPGTYLVSVYDNNDCFLEIFFPITEPAVLDVQVSGTDALCHGTTTGTGTAIVTGGTTPYAYSWSPSGGTASTASLGYGSYTCDVTDAHGCTANNSVFINEPSALSVSVYYYQQPRCHNGTNGYASIQANGGTPGYSYLWSPSGETTRNPNNLPSGYNVYTITDNNGCVYKDSFYLNNPDTIVYSVAITNVSCFNGHDGTATVIPVPQFFPNIQGAGPPPGSFYYLWSPSGNTNATDTGLTAGTYTCLITDNNGCTITATVTITEPPLLTMHIDTGTILCHGGNTTVTISAAGGTPPYSGTGTFTVIADTFTYVVIDANNCFVSQTIIMHERPAVTATTTVIQPVNCNGGSNASATVTAGGGKPGYTYKWSASAGGQTMATAINLTGGTHGVTVTDANGCIASASAFVNQPVFTLIASSVIASPIYCNGSSGLVTVSATGGTPPYTGTGNLSANAGNNIYTVTDNGGCSASTTINLTAPPALSITTSTSNFNGYAVSCKNGSNGTATVNVTGGTPGYFYEWNDNSGQTTMTATNLTAGNYTVTVWDNNDCSTSADVTLAEPSQLLATSEADTIFCHGGSTTVEVKGSGGVSPYTGTGMFTVIAGTYNYQVTDANGCAASTTAVVTEPTLLSISVVVTSMPCEGATTKVVVTATGGTPPYTGVGAFDEYAGTYAYTVTDAYGCSASAIATIIARPKPYLGLDLSDSICAGQSFDLTAVAYNGLHPQIWDAAIPDSVTAPGFYNGIYTSPNGCLDTVMQEIFVKPLPLVPVWNSGLQNVCVPRDSVLYYVYPDSAVYYVWTYTGFGGKLVADSSNTAYIDYGDFATDGKIQVIAVAKNGCGHSAPAIFDIHILHPPVITLLSNDADNTICLGKDVTYTATGGHDYQWYVNGSLVQGEVGSVYQFRPDNDTLYTVVAVAINICGRDTAPTELLDVLETPVVDAGVDTSIGLGNWVMLHGSVKGISPFVYNWTPAVTLSDPTIPNPIATPRDSTLYTLTVSNQYGCVASDDVFVGVYVDGVYNFPNLITPNGDGANDKWIIDLKEFPDGNLIIFNRWGEVVYENSAYDNTWDGTYKGKALDDGTYYFVMKVPSLNNKIYKSAINIIRTK